MGDEGKIVDLTPLKRAPTGDLKRVAEIVMVLSAMGEMRAGKDPTAVEKAMAAEARERLAGICERVLKPKDLISRESVRVVVEDLGLNRNGDPMMGFRPSKMSIAEKLKLTKRKMEEFKRFAPHSSVYSSQHAPVESHGSSMRQSPMGFSTGGFQSVPLGVHVPTVTSITPTLKQSHVNETQLATTPQKSSTTSLEKDSPLLAQKHAGAPHHRLDGRFNGSPYSTQVQAVSTEKTPATSSVQSTPAAHMKLEGAHAQAHDQFAKNQGANVSETPGAPSNLPTGPSFFTNHGDICKSVQKILQPKVFDHPNWNPPSAEYTNKPLNCQICKVPIADVESLLVCDACEKGTHLKCLQSFGNKEVAPKAEWHCPRCLLTSNGKPFPPKYGRVTRAIAPQTTPSNIVATGAAKVDQRRSVDNANVGLPAHASSSLTSCGESSRDLKTAHALDAQSGLKKEVEQLTVTSSNNLVEKTGVVCALPRAKTESSDEDTKRSGSLTGDMKKSTVENQTQIEKGVVVPSTVTSAEGESSDNEMKHSRSTNCTTEQVGIVCAPPSAEIDSSDRDIKGGGPTNPSTEQGAICDPCAEAEISDKGVKSSEFPTSNMNRSTFVSVLDQKFESELSCSENPLIKTTNQSEAPSETKDMKDPISVEVSTDQ